MADCLLSAVEIAARDLAGTRPPDLDPDPFRAFAAWLEEAGRSEPNDANAMTLATAEAGQPSARIVLLKGMEPGRGGEPGGFVFYTNKLSRKGAELAANPLAALLFHWKSLRRQVRIEGRVEDVSDADADAYFATRARISRLGAIASEQSRPLRDRAELERRVAELDARHPGADIPRPPHWSGYRLRPARFEFWQEMPYRLHDRSVYVASAGSWRREKLFP
jgi:pyridoxamine 5'-phosphate oxidase